MARVFTQAEAKQLGLPGRKALELVSGDNGARGLTLRLVEIPVPQPGDSPRTPHQHFDFGDFQISRTVIQDGSRGGCHGPSCCGAG